MAYPSFVENGDPNIARIRRPHLIPSQTFGYSSFGCAVIVLFIEVDNGPPAIGRFSPCKLCGYAKILALGISGLRINVKGMSSQPKWEVKP